MSWYFHPENTFPGEMEVLGFEKVKKAKLYEGQVVLPLIYDLLGD